MIRDQNHFSGIRFTELLNKKLGFNAEVFMIVIYDYNSLHFTVIHITQKMKFWGTWVSHSIKHLPSAQVLNRAPYSVGSLLCSLTFPCAHMCALPLSLINLFFFFFKWNSRYLSYYTVLYFSKLGSIVHLSTSIQIVYLTPLNKSSVQYSIVWNIYFGRV